MCVGERGTGDGENADNGILGLRSMSISESSWIPKKKYELHPMQIVLEAHGLGTRNIWKDVQNLCATVRQHKAYPNPS